MRQWPLQYSGFGLYVNQRTVLSCGILLGVCLGGPGTAPALLHSVLTSSWTHPASYLTSSGSKTVRASGTDIKNRRNSSSTC
jgi:hypothetical protein